MIFTIILFSIISLPIFIAEITIVPITGYYLYSSGKREYLQLYWLKSSIIFSLQKG